ncbi:MAG: deoxyhypusine synthase family protein [Candidatus Blackburnbacteria bacterium]|nr:deoxyhypusine synthase family protein [Candidatus Blackburnbacteria bacterium]
MPAKHKQYLRPRENLPAGHEHGWKPLRSLDVGSLHTFAQLTDAMGETPFEGGNVGHAVNTLAQVVKDPDTFIVMTVAGAMTPAKMGLLICEMVDRGWVQAIVSTGALMAHGFVEAVGRDHFRVPQGVSDEELYRKGFNRIYTALEPESNLDAVEGIFYGVMEEQNPGRVLSSRAITSALGEYLEKKVTGRGILKSCSQKGVPVFIPAFTDSELGLDMGLLNLQRVREGLPRLKYDPFIDLDFYAELIRKQTGKKLAIFTIGGGVPRNWAQQVGPYLDLVAKRAGDKEEDPVMFHYGVRICPEPVEWGGLSGCTYQEGKSWGKFQPDGQFVEVLTDATVVWPLIVAATIEKVGTAEIKKNVFAGKKAVAEIEQQIESAYK